jgi:hypothetical protein
MAGQETADGRVRGGDGGGASGYRGSGWRARVGGRSVSAAHR